MEKEINVGGIVIVTNPKSPIYGLKSRVEIVMPEDLLILVGNCVAFKSEVSICEEPLDAADSILIDWLTPPIYVG
jgi:hypothetical protein